MKVASLFAPLSFTEMAPENPGQQDHHYHQQQPPQAYTTTYTLPRHWAIDKRSHAGGRVAGALPDVHPLFDQPGEIPRDTISQKHCALLYLCIQMLTAYYDSKHTDNIDSAI